MPSDRGPLSQDELDAYRRDGFVVPAFRLADDRLAQLQRLTERLVAENPQMADAPIASPHVPGSGPQAVKGDRAFLQIATQPDILDLVEQIVGPDIILWGTTMFYKKPRQANATPWHRDGFAWPIEPLATTSIWIAAYDSTVANGCLRCIPGSHAARQVGTHDRSRRDDLFFSGALDGGEFDESTARDIELQAGQMVVFDVYTIHGARPNSGASVRAGYSLRFMPGTSFFNHDSRADSDEPGFSHTSRPLLLVRGQDRTGRNDFRRGHPVPLVA